MTNPGSPAVEERLAKKELDAAAGTCREQITKGKALPQHLKPKDLQALQDRYSRFEDITDNEGYLVDSIHAIHRPMTPRPYFHALNNFKISDQAYGALWDQAGRGYSFLH